MKKSISRQGTIKKLDKEFSLLVRTRDKWTCFRCYKVYTPPTSALHNSHFFSRRFYGTRWDLKNCDAACYGCHRYVEGDKEGWYKEYKIKQLGQQQYNYMQMRAYGKTKFSHDDLDLLLDEIKRSRLD